MGRDSRRGARASSHPRTSWWSISLISLLATISGSNMTRMFFASLEPTISWSRRHATLVGGACDSCDGPYGGQRAFYSRNRTCRVISWNVDGSGEFRGQRILIVGKGNSAFETADNLIESAAVLHLVSPSPVRMAWRTRFVGDLRAVNNNVLDTYGLKLQNTVLDADVETIRRSGDTLNVRFRYTHAQGHELSLR